MSLSTRDALAGPELRDAREPCDLRDSHDLRDRPGSHDTRELRDVCDLRRLPRLDAAGAAQMAVDEGLLDEARVVTARRYRWIPPTVSLGKFQRVSGKAEHLLAEAGLAVVRRPSGGRAVLHGSGFEWSFAVAFPACLLPFGTETPYTMVSDAFAAALAAAGVALDDRREADYERSALCFSSPLRHDLLAGGEKVVAVAQAQRGGRALVHGSVLERRPPLELTAVLETALGEPWRGDGLAGAGRGIEGEALWRAVTARLSASLTALADRSESAT